MRSMAHVRFGVELEAIRFEMAKFIFDDLELKKTIIEEYIAKAISIEAIHKDIERQVSDIVNQEISEWVRKKLNSEQQIFTQKIKQAVKERMKFLYADCE